MARPLRRHTATALALLGVLFLGGCAINPATGQNQLMLVSEEQGIAMGREADPAIIASIGLLPDAGWQSYIQEFGTRLAATSERPDLPWTFRVADDPAVNAFAVPGGFVYVTRGLLTHLTSEAELASVVGHEIGHITARHTAAAMSRQQLFGVGLALGSIASSDFARYAGTASQALGILYLRYSRDNESQADELGLRYLQRANFDPRPMPDVFTMLERLSASESGGTQLPTWLATHPSAGSRATSITHQIAALPQDFAGTVVGGDAYLRRLDGLVFGMNPREGYFEGGLFLHPDMRFQVSFPEGWVTHNGREAVVAGSPEQDAVIQLGAAWEASADHAAHAFLAQEGVQAGAMSRASLHGLTTVSAAFGAETADGHLRGMVRFVEHGGTVFGLIGYAPDAPWQTHHAAIERTLGSFQPLTDPEALGRQPQRVEIIKLDRRTTIESLARERHSAVTPATLALINQVEIRTPLEAGRLVKWIVGPR